MIKFKNEKKEFTIVFNAEDCTDNKVYDYVVSEEGVKLIMDNSDVFIMDSNTDIDEWNDQFYIEDEDDWNVLKEDWSLEDYFDFVEEAEEE